MKAINYVLIGMGVIIGAAASSRTPRDAFPPRAETLLRSVVRPFKRESGFAFGKEEPPNAKSLARKGEANTRGERRRAAVGTLV